MLVTKRNGQRVPYDPDKINEFLEYVCEGIEGVSMSDIAMNAKLFLYDGMTTKEINANMLKSAENLISVETPNYDLVSGRILISELRKEAYGDFEPDSLYTIISRNISLGKYDPEILDYYTVEQIEELDSYIDHERDYNYTIAGVREWADKYLVQNRETKEYYESPQVAYMLMAMCYFLKDDGNDEWSKLDLVKAHYDNLSLGRWNSPTPQTAGLRTTSRVYSSCTVIEGEDSIDGISAVETAAKKYATLKAGLGIGAHNLRGRKQAIRNGDAINTGALYHAKSIEESILSCTQGNVRKGSCTFNWLGWHLDYEEMINYKNNSKPLAESMQHSDHFFMFNGYLLKRALSGNDIYLFSPETVPELKKAFFSHRLDDFKRLYEEAISNHAIKKNKISGREYLSLLIKERTGTGRIYIGFADNMNKYSPYIDEVAPIRMSNLCVEINLPTEPLEFKYNDDSTISLDGLIALCNLGGINWGSINSKEEFLIIAYVGLRALDNILSSQYYPFEASRKHNDLYRPVGIGITGLAYWMAKNDVNYSNCYELLDEWADYFAYSIVKASIDLAKERGHCQGYKNTKWSLGQFPVDNVAPATNEIVEHVVRPHWEELRPLLKEYGVRNSSMIALMPSETSAKVSGRGTTNGIEPIRDFIVSKGGKSSKGKFVAPDLHELKDKYDLVWEWQGCSQLIRTYAILQKYVDQAISCNTYYSRNNFPGGVIPADVVLGDIIDAYRYGIKSLYYNNNDDSTEEVVVNKNAIEIRSAEEESDFGEEYCESCVL